MLADSIPPESPGSGLGLGTRFHSPMQTKRFPQSQMTSARLLFTPSDNVPLHSDFDPVDPLLYGVSFRVNERHKGAQRRQVRSFPAAKRPRLSWFPP
jgi:hypothetical protein